MADVKVRVKGPIVPNFIQTLHGGTVPVGDLTNEELSEIADDWKVRLIENAERQRRMNTGAHDDR